MGILAGLVAVFFALQFAHVIRWQVRAQNAADAAAQGALAVQSQQWNAMTATLYAAAIEEFRVRRLLNAMVLAVHGQGGCDATSLGIRGQAYNDGVTCESIYEALQPQYLKAVNRYTNDVILLNRATANISWANLQSDIRAFIDNLNDPAQCGDGIARAPMPAGGDCRFFYRVVRVDRRLNTSAVLSDGWKIIQPGSDAGHQTGPSGANGNFFAPANIEIAVCAKVDPLVPNLFGFKPKKFTAIGRSAGTTVLVEQDWLQPGSVNNPLTGVRFQASEPFAPRTVDPDGRYDWYLVDFAGNAALAQPNQNRYLSPVFDDEFSERTGWWNSIPIAPASTAINPADVCQR